MPAPTSAPPAPVLPGPLQTDRRHAAPSSWRVFLIRTLAVALIASLLFLAWTARDALLLAVAALVVAVLLDAPTRLLVARTRLPRVWALAITGVAIGLILAAFVWFAGRQVQAQASALISEILGAAQSLEERLGLPLLGGGTDLDDLSSEEMSGWTGLVRQTASWGFTIVGMAATAVLVVIGGFFLAANPHLYRRGLVKLFPKDRHDEVGMALDKCGLALRQWLIAELIAMTIVGVLAGFGTWALGLGAPLALGLFAGLTEFVPIVGPFVGAVPALVLAVSQSWSMFLWTALLYLGIQQVESNLITPMVMRHETTVPPALLLLAVFAFGLLFGALGVIVAAPLTILLYVLVRELYVRRTLGERLGGGEG